MIHKPTKETYILLLSIFAMGVMPFLHMNYRDLMEVWGGSIQVTGSIVELVVWIGIMIALIYGVLARKWMTISWLWVALYTRLLNLVKHILIFGSYGEEKKIVISSIIFFILFYIFRNQDIRSQFSLKEKHLKCEKIVNGVTGIIIILVFAFYGIFVFSQMNKKINIFSSPIKIDLEVNNSDSKEGYFLENVFGWKILLPSKTRVKEDKCNKDDDFDKSVVFVGEDESFRIIVNKENPMLNSEWSRFGLKMDSDYELIRKMYYEKIGITFLVLKSSKFRKNSMSYELNIGELRGFMNKGIIDKKRVFYDYSLFDKNDNHVNILFVVKSDDMSRDEVLDIISTVRGPK